MTGSTEKHESLVNEILLHYGAKPWLRLWENKTGAAFRRGRPIRYGLVGSADIIGILEKGIFVAIECKTGRARQTKQQKNFQKMIESLGGIYIVARSLNDVEAKLMR